MLDVMTKPVIDPEFAGAMIPLPAEERVQLEANLLADGCLDPLKTWRGLLVDGHNRLEICEAHDIDFDVVEIDRPDRASVLDWIDTNQLGRRNLTPDQRTMIIARVYARRKKKHGGDRKSEESKPQNEDLKKTSAVVAAEFGVSKATVERAAIFEYCAGFSRPEAERRASEVVRIEKLKQPAESTEQQTTIPGMEAKMEFI